MLDMSQPWRLPIELERLINIACGRSALQFKSQIQESRDERWRELVFSHMEDKPEETDGPPLRALYKSDVKVALEVFIAGLRFVDEKEAEQAVGSLFKKVALR